MWRHTAYGQTRLQFLGFAVVLETIGLWGLSFDCRPYWFYPRKGVEPFWGFVWRMRQIGLDIACVIFGVICLMRALTH